MKLHALGIWAVATTGETTSFLVERGDNRMLIDVGINPSLSLAKLSVPLTSITDVFISHCHSDHMQGFANFVFTRDAQQRQFGAASKLRVIAALDNIKKAQELLKIFYPEREFDVQWVPVKPGDNTILGDVSLGYFETDHTVPGLGLLISHDEDKLLVFTSDTALSDTVREACRGAQMLVGECFGLEADFRAIAGRLKHLCAEDLATLADEAGVSNLVPFHLHAPYAVEANRNRLVETIESLYHGKVIVLLPGQSTEVTE